MPHAPDVHPARLYPVATGTRLFRIHHRDYPGASFNPCRGMATRFAPLRTPEGQCIPTLYASTTFDGAAYETVFRGDPGPFSAVPRQNLDDRGASIIAPKQDLALVPFFTPELKSMRIDPEQFFRPSAAAYPACRSLAERAWNDNGTAHGIAWTSVRDSSAQAMLLFGDRLALDDFDHFGTRDIASDPSLLDDFVNAGERGGFRISR